MPAERSGTSGRPSNAGPCAHVFESTAEVQHSVCDRLSEGEKRSANPSDAVERAASDRPALLGKRILREHCWIG